MTDFELTSSNKMKIKRPLSSVVGMHLESLLSLFRGWWQWEVKRKTLRSFRVSWPRASRWGGSSSAWIREVLAFGEELAGSGLVHVIGKRALDSFHLLIHENVKRGTPWPDQTWSFQANLTFSSSMAKGYTATPRCPCCKKIQTQVETSESGWIQRNP